MTAAIRHVTTPTVRRSLLLVFLMAVVGVRPSAESQSFLASSPMLAAAEAATAILLEDGDVLLVGDAMGSQPELYDSPDGSFSIVGDAAAPQRAGASGVRLDDGRVLVVGGWNRTAALATASIFNPTAGSFTELAKGMSVARIHPTATLLPDGRVLVVGGYNEAGVQGSAELFDPGTGAFSLVAQLSEPRRASATLLLDGRVLFAGGLSAAGQCTATVDIFDPSLGSFESGPSLTQPRCDHQAVRLGDGRVLVIGGHADATLLTNAEIFDPANGTFAPAGTLQVARAHHRSVTLATGDVLVVGGYGPDGPLASSEVYSATAASFGLGPTLLEARVWPTVAVLADGRVLVAGGRGVGGEVLATTEALAVDARVIRSETTTVLSSSVRATTYGQPVTYYARVTSAKGRPDGVVQFLDSGTRVLATATLDASGAAQATLTDTPAGTRPITAVYKGSGRFGSSESLSVTQQVEPADAKASLTVSPLQRQYSDRVTLVATVTPVNAAESVTFKVGNQVLGTAPIMGGKAQLAPPLLGAVPPGVRIITAVFNQAERNYEIYSPYKSMAAVQEDARVAFTGATSMNTGCTSCSTTTVRLEATVRDISLVSPAMDADAGDVGTATVTFVNRATGAVIQKVAVTPDPNDRRIGKAVYNWPVNIGKNSSQTFTIGMAVGNQYIRNSTLDDAKVTVVKR